MKIATIALASAISVGMATASMAATAPAPVGKVVEYAAVAPAKQQVLPHHGAVLGCVIGIGIAAATHGVLGWRLALTSCAIGVVGGVVVDTIVEGN